MEVTAGTKWNHSGIVVKYPTAATTLFYFDVYFQVVDLCLLTVEVVIVTLF